MQLACWSAPGGSEELVVRMGPTDASVRVLVLPAWFDEANKTRHFTIEMMRELALLGVASDLPDLPGCNESLARLEEQSLASWRAAAASAADELGSTHVLAIRASVAIAPKTPGWAYAPVAGKSVLRSLLRVRVMASREAVRAETSEDLLAAGRSEGLALAGYRLGSALVADLADHADTASPLGEIAQAALGGPGLWLRAEPDHDAAQAKALAALIAQGLQP
ncbi:MAG: hypothetical protein ABIT10_11415 [Alteraurantiacibacter sp.]